MMIDLPLDNDEEHPRRLLSVGSHVVVYGGDDGTLAAIRHDNNNNTTAVPFRRFDEESVRAVAVSDDGRRVVIGSDSGMTQVYVYEQYVRLTGQQQQHPFVANGLGKSTDNDDDDILASQSDDLQAVYSGETLWAGPSYEAPVRSLQFLPGSYHVVVATETSLAIVNVQSPDSILEPATELAEEGVRGVAVTKLPNTTSSSSTSMLLLLSALDMNGRLTHYQLSHSNNNNDNNNTSTIIQSTVLRKESRLVVEKRDVGEMLGASPACRSCRPLWLTTTSMGRNNNNNNSQVLVVGGQTYLQLRRLVTTTTGGDSVVQLEEEDQPLSVVANAGDDASSLLQGHLDSIVYTQAIGTDGYVVSCGRDKRLVLWKLSTTNNKRSSSDPHSLQAHYVRTLPSACDDDDDGAVPTDLLWLSKEERLYVVLANAKLVVWEGYSHIVPPNTTTTTTTTSTTAAEEQDVMEEPATVSAPTNQRDSNQEMNDDDANVLGDHDNDDDLADFLADGLESPAKDKNHEPPSKKNRFVDDEAEDDDDDDDDMGPTQYDDIATQSPSMRRSSDFPEPDDDDDDDGRSEGANSFDMDQFRSTTTRAHHSMPTTLKMPDPQPAFAPSSTPLDMTRRFMCWNHIGAVTHTQGVPGVSRSSIDIDFTDTLTRRPVSFTDNMGFILGSVGEDGGIFATDLAEDEDEDDDNLNDVVEGLHMSETTKAALKKSQKQRMAKSGSKATGSTLFFHRFETFAATRDKDWYLTLPDGERALGCACGEGWAAAMTSRRFLRLFSSGGNQGQVIWLPGEPVTMVGRGRFLAVFYHEGPPLMDETQKLGFMLIDAVTVKTVAKGTVSCISSGSSLAWAGMTNECSLVTMDSDGMLSMLASSGVEEGNDDMSWEWIPMLDTVGLRKSFDDSYWPVTVYDGKLVCVPLKGGVKHPDAARRPVTTTLGLRLPLARGTLTSVNALEELSVRADIAFKQKKVVHTLLGDAEDEELEGELRTISAQLDKVTLKMFAAVVEAGKLERALDLVERLHLEKSFDLAMKIADHHRRLVDLIEEAKERRFGGDDEYDDDDGDDDGAISDEESPRGNVTAAMDHQRITPDASSIRRTKRAFDDIPAGDMKLGGNRRVRAKGVFG